MSSWKFLLLTVCGYLGYYSCEGAYRLIRHYDYRNFFESVKFDLSQERGDAFNEPVNEREARWLNITHITSDNKIYIGVDHKNKLKPEAIGRKSVYLFIDWIKFDHGLFIYDIQHVPTGTGTWPGLFMVGGNRPWNGEIDILEGIGGIDRNRTKKNSMAVITSPGCTMEVSYNKLFKGRWKKEWVNGKQSKPDTRCDEKVPGSDGEALDDFVTLGETPGCTIQSPDGYWGWTLNKGGGGVFAVELVKNKHVKIWNIKRTDISRDIRKVIDNPWHRPNPNKWVKPMAYYKFGKQNKKCPGNRFKGLFISLQTFFCGKWTGKEFPVGREHCHRYVRNHPQDYTDTYWLINSINVYQDSARNKG